MSCAAVFYAADVNFTQGVSMYRIDSSSVVYDNWSFLEMPAVSISVLEKVMTLLTSLLKDCSFISNMRRDMPCPVILLLSIQFCVDRSVH
jgi:hypothetical protein